MARLRWAMRAIDPLRGRAAAIIHQSRWIPSLDPGILGTPASMHNRSSCWPARAGTLSATIFSILPKWRELPGHERCRACRYTPDTPGPSWETAGRPRRACPARWAARQIGQNPGFPPLEQSCCQDPLQAKVSPHTLMLCSKSTAPARRTSGGSVAPRPIVPSVALRCGTKPRFAPHAAPIWVETHRLSRRSSGGFAADG